MVKELRYELGHIISYKTDCPPSEDSDQIAHPHILSRTSAPVYESLGCLVIHRAQSND